jgi:hypothetical protein
MLLLDHESLGVVALSLQALIGRCRSTLASYVADEKIRGNIPFSRYALHDMIIGYELYLNNRVEYGKRSYYMYCINYGSFNYGQSRSGRLSETPSKYA